MNKKLLKVWLRFYLWFHDICPEHGPMDLWESEGGCGSYCKTCDNERDAKQAQAINHAMQEYHTL